MSVATTANTDPRYAHILSEFLSAMGSSKVISYAKLSFIEKIGTIEYPIWNILTDYLYEFKQSAVSVTLSDAEQQKYFYRPKLLCSDIYGTTEVYYVILALNGICNVKEFNMNPLLMLNKEDMSDFLSTIYNAERTAISTYNTDHS
jgi:hypothetical protein